MYKIKRKDLVGFFIFKNMLINLFLILISIINQTISRHLDLFDADAFIITNECPDNWIEKNNKCFYISKHSTTWTKVLT